MLDGEFRMSIADLFDLESEVVFLQMVLRKIHKKYPNTKISEKTLLRLKNKARAHVEFEYDYHKIKQH
jgi:hypothetical protein